LANYSPDVGLEVIAFNSLSRDHANIPASDSLSIADFAFQLPLSGSQSRGSIDPERGAQDLSTPSLGITWKKSYKMRAMEARFQLPLSGSLKR